MDEESALQDDGIVVDLEAFLLNLVVGLECNGLACASSLECFIVAFLSVSSAFAATQYLLVFISLRRVHHLLPLTGFLSAIRTFLVAYATSYLPLRTPGPSAIPLNLRACANRGRSRRKVAAKDPS